MFTGSCPDGPVASSKFRETGLMQGLRFFIGAMPSPFRGEIFLVIDKKQA
jgi:hypothetical protein